MTRVQYLIIRARNGHKLTVFRIRWAFMSKAGRENMRRRAALLVPPGAEESFPPKFAAMLFPDRMT
jgi:hypothetical protein